MKDQKPNPPSPAPEDEGAIVPAGQGEILLYQTEDGQTRVECRFQDETIWLSSEPDSRFVSDDQAEHKSAPAQPL